MLATIASSSGPGARTEVTDAVLTCANANLWSNGADDAERLWCPR